ncbi:MAG: histidine phosphatase family protein [Verrucomicrobiota bacterium]|nr:histidine phosphatase family protein [Limisphaera sp.]MDW8381709.1 histidine phosphatase family protein [Verrucomicrobiota bacterium]
MSDQPTRLYFIRHAEVATPFQRVFAGRLDIPLSDHGHQQARSMTSWLTRLSPHAVYASPMLRVQQTLQPWLQRGAPKPVLCSELREVDFGDWTGVSWDEVEPRFGQNPWHWLRLLEQNAIPRAEPFEAFRQRVGSCLHRILAEQVGRSVVILGHGGVIRMALADLCQWPLAATAALAIDYASVTRVRVDPGRVEIELLNYLPWLNSS